MATKVGGAVTVEIDGIKVTIDPAVFADFKTQCALKDAEDLGKGRRNERNAFAFVTLYRLVFGDEQGDTIMDALSADDGSLPMDKAVSFLFQAMQAVAEKVKDSQDGAAVKNS